MASGQITDLTDEIQGNVFQNASIVNIRKTFKLLPFVFGIGHKFLIPKLVIFLPLHFTAGLRADFFDIAWSMMEQILERSR